MERQRNAGMAFPDFASLHPGYKAKGQVCVQDYDIALPAHRL
jgi:hypothetical protein